MSIITLTPSSTLNAPSTATAIPARIVRVELSQPLSAIEAFDIQKQRLYQRAIAYVYLHTQPIGAVEFILPEQGVSASKCAERIWECLSEQIDMHLRADGLSTPEGLDAHGIPSSSLPRCEQERERFLERAPLVSVIVPTHDRPNDLRFSLPTLAALRYSRYELIIVDNAPSSDETAKVVQELCSQYPHVRYIREDRPGISWARNTGIRMARGEILAFTDDDVEADPNWLLELVRNFEDAPFVGCVTGQVQPLELETMAQYWCEENAGLYWFQEQNDPARRFIRRVFHRSRRHVHLYRVGLFGCGASMAFRAHVLHEIEGFDPAMGGTGPSRCGQDIAAFFQTLMRGYKVIYEPDSLVYHVHRRTYEGLRKQFYNYGIGLTAYLTKNVYEYPQLLLDLMTKVPYDLFVVRPNVINKKTAQYPEDLRKVAHKGMIFGPIAYVLSRAAARRLGRHYPPLWARFPLLRKGYHSHEEFPMAMD